MDPGELSVGTTLVDHVQPVDNKRHGALGNNNHEHQTVRAVSDGNSHAGHHDSNDEEQEAQPGWLDSDAAPLDSPDDPDSGDSIY